MGRTFEILKQAEATHFSSGEKGGGPVLNLADSSQLDPSNSTEAVPYVEVGGPGRAMEGSPDVMSGFGGLGEPGAAASGVRRGASLPLHRIPHPQTSKFSGPYPVSVAFRPLDSLQPVEGKLGRVAPEIIAFHQPNHPVSHGYETLAEAIEAQLPMGGSHVLMFTGAAEGVGTTAVVLNLAFTWARPGHKRIVVVDAGDGAPQGAMAKKLGASPGLREGTVERFKNLSFHFFRAPPTAHRPPSGSPPEAGGRSRGEMRDMLRQLRKQFDLILLDTPPWDSSQNTVALASGCDAIYLLLPESAANTAETDELIKAIQGQGIYLGGCVLTKKAPLPTAGSSSRSGPNTCLNQDERASDP